MKYCKHCGKEVNDGAAVCLNCGCKIDDTEFTRPCKTVKNKSQLAQVYSFVNNNFWYLRHRGDVKYQL